MTTTYRGSRGDGLPARAGRAGGGAAAGTFFGAAPRSPARAPWHPRAEGRGRASPESQARPRRRVGGATGFPPFLRGLSLSK